MLRRVHTFIIVQLRSVHTYRITIHRNLPIVQKSIIDMFVKNLRRMA